MWYGRFCRKLVEKLQVKNFLMNSLDQSYDSRVLTTAETSSVSAWFNQLHIRAVVIAEATRWVSITTVATVGVILPPIIVRLQSES